MQKKKPTLPAPGGGRVDASRIPKPSLSKEDSAFIKKMSASGPTVKQAAAKMYAKPDSTKKGKKK